MTKLHIALGKKAPAGIAVDLDRMFESDEYRTRFESLMNESAALRYVVEYGFKQSLNDAIAAIKTTDKDYSTENTVAMAAKRLDAIMTGSVKSRGTGEGPADPYAVEARKLARAAFMAKPEQARKAAVLTIMKRDGVDDKTATRSIIAAFAEQPAIMEKAIANVDAARAAAAEMADGIDLDALFGDDETE